MVKESPLTKGEQTRRYVLEAARQLFLSQGYTATSMRQIARAVGITPAAIYNHFSGKEEIFTTLLEEAAPFERVFEVFARAEADTLEDLLQRMVRDMIDSLLSHEDYVQLSLIDAQERDGATIITFLPRLLPHLMEFYQRLVALDADQGRLRDISPFLFMRALVSLIAGFLITERVARPTETLDLPEMDWVQGLANIFIYGVLSPPEMKRR